MIGSEIEISTRACNPSIHRLYLDSASSGRGRLRLFSFLRWIVPFPKTPWILRFMEAASGFQSSVLRIDGLFSSHVLAIWGWFGWPRYSKQVTTLRAITYRYNGEQGLIICSCYYFQNITLILLILINIPLAMLLAFYIFEAEFLILTKAVQI